MYLKKSFFIIFILFQSLLIHAQRTVGIFQNDSSSLNGYTLIAPLNSNNTYLINNCGNIVNEWNTSTYKPGASVELLADGSILRTGKITTGTILAGGSGGKIEKFDWNDNLTWSYDFDGSNQRQHHEVKELPNGNLLVLSWDVRTKQQAINDGLDTNLYNGELWSEKLVEIQPVGLNSANIIWEWHLKDHLIQDFNSTVNNYGNINQNPQLINLNYYNNSGPFQDFYHANGIDYNSDLDQIIISIRNFDEIWIIDHSTTTAEAATHFGGNSGKGGDILYRWGNPEAYNRGVVSDKKLYGQHNPSWIKNGYRDEGKIMIFNNGYNDTNQVSKVEIIDPPIDSSGSYITPLTSYYLPATVDWSYNLPLFVDFVSGAERLSNGNTLICSGPDGHLYELDQNDSVVWEYINPAGLTVTSQGNFPSSNSLFRANRYEENFPAFLNRNIRATTPIELNPTTSNCVLHPIHTSIYSPETKLKVIIVQNPINEFLQIINNSEQIININVFDLFGKRINSTSSSLSEIRIDSRSWKSQIYLVSITNEDKVFNQKILKQ